MITIYIPDKLNSNEVRILRIIDDNDNYYSDVMINSKTKRIELKPCDYYKILDAMDNNKRMKIQPGEDSYELEIISN